MKKHGGLVGAEQHVSNLPSGFQQFLTAFNGFYSTFDLRHRLVADVDNHIGSRSSNRHPTSDCSSESSRRHPMNYTSEH